MPDPVILTRLKTIKVIWLSHNTEIKKEGLVAVYLNKIAQSYLRSVLPLKKV